MNSFPNQLNRGNYSHNRMIAPPQNQCQIKWHFFVWLAKITLCFHLTYNFHEMEQRHNEATQTSNIILSDLSPEEREAFGSVFHLRAEVIQSLLEPCD